ncbi:hypothetical protein LZ32DRAFT_92001 [Colletotrichum eremochloae]|nr:hypothetical protein LZ32DRAFT_92001 [Colletotrichum eremochloae]
MAADLVVSNLAGYAAACIPAGWVAVDDSRAKSLFGRSIIIVAGTNLHGVIEHIVKPFFFFIIITPPTGNWLFATWA